jgi:hypothetical protein
LTPEILAFETPAIGDSMSTDDLHHERRASQRFDFQLPVGVRLAGTDCEGYGFTQDLSGRGVFFYTDFRVAEGDTVELTLVMPSEITLTENARVRCRGRVVRVVPVEQKFGVAARLEGYEYLPKAETAAQISANFPRISTVHSVTQTGQKLPLPVSVEPVSVEPVSVEPVSGGSASGVTGSSATVTVPTSSIEGPEGDQLGNG